MVLLITRDDQLVPSLETRRTPSNLPGATMNLPLPQAIWNESPPVELCSAQFTPSVEVNTCPEPPAVNVPPPKATACRPSDAPAFDTFQETRSVELAARPPLLVPEPT